MMHEKKLEIYLFFILLAIALYLVFGIFSPYLYAIILAVVFAIIFNPVHRKISNWMPRHQSLPALITLFTVVIVVVVPLVFFGIQLSDEVKNMYDYIFKNSDNIGFADRLTDAANGLLTNFSPFKPDSPVFDASDTKGYVLASLSWVRGHFGDIFSGLAKFFVNMFLFLIALYYFLKDGLKFKKQIVEISPFQDDRDELILEKLRLAVISIAKGSILVSLMQGVLAIIGFSIFGVPSPVLWGSIAIVAALIPGIGTALVMFPAVLFLFFTGNIPQAIGLLIWAVVAVGLVDNILGPKLVHKGIKIHPFLILISALGGIGYFGPIGFILGPIALSFLFTLLDIYKTIIIKDSVKNQPIK